MRFAYDLFDFPALAIVIGCALVWVGFVVALLLASTARVRAEKRFGDPALVAKLATFDATARRATKGVLLSAAIALAFFALARPQFGRGTRLIPATNLDIAIVLDYSKSMYARDIQPSRITRAKAEVARLIEKLPGARFSAVAFAGEPMAFPLTSDGAAIGQFFRQLEPNDMPVGGTATARALERAREMLNRDPKAKNHVKVIVLVTDGEDLEGDPVEVAKECAEDRIRIDVVQIGSRAPEVIPNVAADGKVSGIRHDDEGKPLMTELSAEGEAQLSRVASESQGMIVRSENGETGIDKVAQALSQMMKDELSEKVETVYGEEYAWPLGAALLLFIVEAFIGEAPKKKESHEGCPPLRLEKNANAERRLEAHMRPRDPSGCAAGSRAFRRIRRRSRVALFVAIASLVATACAWDPSHPFDHEVGEVNKAVSALDAGDATLAAQTLEEYLQTGECNSGSLGTPDLVKRRADGTFDLGLALFKIGEAFGQRFGDEEEGDAGSPDVVEKRQASVNCALHVVEAIANGVPAANQDPREAASIPLRARAHYLAGNLHFLNGEYEDAVKEYDAALGLAPGEEDAGDPVGRDAAWNRAIALRRIEDKKKDGGPPDGGNGDGGNGSDGGGDGGGKDGGGDGGGGNNDKNDAGKDAGNNSPDAGQPPPPQNEPDAGAPPPPPQSASADDRILDRLERAPTVQQEAAKKSAARNHTRGMVDK